MEGWLSKVVDKGDVTDPYVDVRLGNAKIAKTRFDVVTSMFPCVCLKVVLLGAFAADDKFFEVFFRATYGAVSALLLLSIVTLLLLELLHYWCW